MIVYRIKYFDEYHSELVWYRNLRVIENCKKFVVGIILYYSKNFSYLSKLFNHNWYSLHCKLQYERKVICFYIVFNWGMLLSYGYDVTERFRYLQKIKILKHSLQSICSLSLISRGIRREEYFGTGHKKRLRFFKRNDVPTLSWFHALKHKNNMVSIQSCRVHKTCTLKYASSNGKVRRILLRNKHNEEIILSFSTISIRFHNCRNVYNLLSLQKQCNCRFTFCCWHLFSCVTRIIKQVTHSLDLFSTVLWTVITFPLLYISLPNCSLILSHFLFSIPLFTCFHQCSFMLITKQQAHSSSKDGLGSCGRYVRKFLENRPLFRSPNIQF